MDYNLGDCRVSGGDRRVELVCWFGEGWLVGDGRIVSPTLVQDVRGRETHDLHDPWIAHVFGDPGGFVPLKVVGHGPAGWLTDKGPFVSICEPAPVPPKCRPLRDAAGKAIRFPAKDAYEAALHPQYDSNNPGPGPGDCTVVGHRGGYWQTATGGLVLPQDLLLYPPRRMQPITFASPIRCLGGGVTAWGAEAEHPPYPTYQFLTDGRPSIFLEGPIPPGSPTSEGRIQGLLARTPDLLLTNIPRLSVTRDSAVTLKEAKAVLKVEPPEELLFDLPHGRLCPVGAFLRWFVGFSEEEVSLIHPPEAVDYRRRLGALIARMDTTSRALWSAMLAGDEQARRDYADVVECQGDPGRAALLRVGLAKHRMRSLDAGWAN